MNIYTDKEIIRRTETALGILYKNDYFLIENKVNERSITHKLAEYLQIQFPDYNVDCEYNKKNLGIKDLEGISECRSSSTEYVNPDIIVHIRNSNDNLLVIEAKISNKSNDNCDKEKLKLFTSINGDYKYSLGLFIIFEEGKPICEWF